MSNRVTDLANQERSALLLSRSLSFINVLAKTVSTVTTLRRDLSVHHAQLQRVPSLKQRRAALPEVVAAVSQLLLRSSPHLAHDALVLRVSWEAFAAVLAECLVHLDTTETPAYPWWRVLHSELDKLMRFVGTYQERLSALEAQFKYDVTHTEVAAREAALSALGKQRSELVRIEGQLRDAKQRVQQKL